MRNSVLFWRNVTKLFPPIFVGVFMGFLGRFSLPRNEVRGPYDLDGSSWLYGSLTRKMRGIRDEGKSFGIKKKELLPHRNHLHFFALIQVVVEIRQLDSFFAAARAACVEADTVEHYAVGCDRGANCPRGHER